MNEVEDDMKNYCNMFQNLSWLFAFIFLDYILEVVFFKPACNLVQIRPKVAFGCVSTFRFRRKPKRNRLN